MSEFSPVTNMAELERMPDDELDAGFFAGMAGAPEPLASFYSRAFWHGWRAGRVHAGIDEPDETLLALEAQYEDAEWTLH